MTLSRVRKSTIMDQQGRVFVNRDIAKAMGLQGGGKIEWFINDDGHVSFRKVKETKKSI
ncbi:MAG: hypothetical protein K2X68_10160 [Novosphingobium sp.]|nr:hypothetical protein [Novosphingobium sp.]